MAELVSASAEELGYAVEIRSYDNPRVEKEEHYYNATHTKLLDLGLEPHLLGEELVKSLLHLIEVHRGRVIEASIEPRTWWQGPERLANEEIADGDERDLILQG